MPFPPTTYQEQLQILSKFDLEIRRMCAAFGPPVAMTDAEKDDFLQKMVESNPWMWQNQGGFTNTGHISPGIANIATLPISMVSGSLPMGTLDIQIAPNGGVANFDVLNLTGNLTLTGAVLNVTETTCLPNGTYPIVSWTGTRTGSFATLVLPAGYSVAYDDAGEKINLIYVDPAPAIVCPANITTGNTPGLCAKTAPALGSPTATDNCPGVSSANNAPASFPVGSTNVIWTATDSKGSTATCLQTVEIQDVETPAITCPANVTHTNDAGLCSATFPISAATATDNCAI